MYNHTCLRQYRDVNNALYGENISAVAVKCTISSTAYLMHLKYYLPQQGYYEDLVQYYNMQNMSHLLQHIISVRGYNIHIFSG